MWFISVRDTGVGIAAEDLPRIFRPLLPRSAAQPTAAPRGSGLGLALAKWIAERHGTQLTVESRPGQGSCFFFSLEGRALSHLLKSAPSVTIAN
jgi:signal transduction histidine kinase